MFDIWSYLHVSINYSKWQALSLSLFVCLFETFEHCAWEWEGGGGWEVGEWRKWYSEKLHCCMFHQILLGWSNERWCGLGHAAHVGESMYVYKTAVSKETKRDRFRKLSGLRHKSMCLVNQHASMKWHTPDTPRQLRAKGCLQCQWVWFILCNFVLDKTWALKGESCDISKWCENRISVLACANVQSSKKLSCCLLNVWSFTCASTTVLRGWFVQCWVSFCYAWTRK